MKTRVVEERRRFKESSILFKSERRRAIDAAISAIRIHRMELETYIALHPGFRYALNPVPVETEAPRIVRLMAQSTTPFDVGPMAAVAGVLADLAVEAMLGAGARIAFVENGGEISVSSDESFTIGLYAGGNALSDRVGFQIDPSECPIGIATSSATVGHAISFGEADAVTVFADTSGIADAAATAICNMVRGRDVEASVRSGLESAEKIGNIIRGVIVVRGKYVGSVGRIPQLVDIRRGSDTDKVSLTDLIGRE